MVTPGMSAASQSRLLLPARRRPASGHRPVLRDRPRHRPRPGRRRHRRATARAGRGNPLGRARRRDGPGRRRQPRDGRLTRESGAISTFVMSFDAVASRAPQIEIHEELASFIAPDPNLFHGDVELRELDGTGWSRSRSAPGTSELARLRDADLVATPAEGAARRWRPRVPRAGRHLSLLESARTGRRVTSRAAAAAGTGAAPVAAELGRGDPDLPLAGLGGHATTARLHATGFDGHASSCVE